MAGTESNNQLDIDITDMVRARRRCGAAAWAGYITACFGIVFAFAIPWLAPIVIALFVVSYGTAKGSPTAAVLHALLLGILIGLVLAERPQAPAMATANRWIALFLSVGFLWSLMGIWSSVAFRRRLPPAAPRDAYGQAVNPFLRIPAMFTAGKFRAIAVACGLAVTCLLPIAVPTGMVLVGEVTTIQRWLGESKIPFWLVLMGFVFLAGPCITGAYFFLTRAKRLAALSVQEAVTKDRRPPILLLRSFQDDLTSIARNLPFTMYAPTDFFGRSWTLEEAVEKILRQYGPVIAIGRPGEKLPPAGAAREYLANEAWQDRVKALIEQARWIVVIAGNTAGLDWEYRQLARQQAWQRLVLVFPPVGEDEKRARWSLFRQATAVTLDNGNPEGPSQALMARFEKHESPWFVRCRWTEEEEFYRLALAWALSPATNIEAVRLQRS